MYFILVFLFYTISFSAASPAQNEESIRFIALGDWGEILLRGQKWVAAEMANWTRENDPQFILTLGDNIYPSGINSVDDIQWERKWYNIYHIYEELDPLPWYISVGNHDYGQSDRQGQEWNQVAFSDVEERWIFPHLWFSFYKEVGNTKVHFICIDTEVIDKEVNDYEAHMEWLETELATSEGDFVIVYGHRHMFSVGDVSITTGSLQIKLRPLLEQYEVDMYLCGHDHNQQHMRHFNESIDIDYVITGAGGALISRYIPDHEDEVNALGVESLHFSASYGFAGFIITEDEMYWEFVKHDGEVLYQYARPRKMKKRHMDL